MNHSFGGNMIGKIFFSIRIFSIVFLCQNCGPKSVVENDVVSTTGGYSAEPINAQSLTNQASSESGILENDFVASRVGCLPNNCNTAKLITLMERSHRGRVILKEIEDYYSLYLQRASDEGGFGFWTDLVYRNVISMDQAKEYIKNSPEAQQLGARPDIQVIPQPERAETVCAADRTRIGRSLSSREGYVTRIVGDISGRSYPKKGLYKEAHSYYCVRQRIRCWAGQVRVAVTNIEHTARYASCGPNNFRNKPETNYSYLKGLNEDFIGIYQVCQNRLPTKREIDRHITSVVENNSSVYENASSICSW